MTTTDEFFEIPLPELHSPEWHEQRRLTWNASLVAALFGEHPYETLADICVAKLSGHIGPATAAMERGTRMEPYVADWLADLTSYKLVTPTVMYGRGCLVSNPDRLVMDRPDLLVEIKTTNEYLRDRPLRYWWYQALGQLACSRTAEKVVIGALDASMDLRLFEVDRENNEEAIEAILRRACEMSLCIQMGELPEGLELSADNVKTLWPQHYDTQVELATTGDLPLNRVRDYIEASAAVKHWEKIKKESRDSMVTALGPNAVGTIAGTPIVSYKTTKPGMAFDMTAFAEDHPTLVRDYTKPTPGYRTFHLIAQGRRTLLPELEEREDEDG